MSKPILSRPYDVALSKLALEFVTRRREAPDGGELKVQTTYRGKEEVAVYPWDQMRLGDFFFVPLRGRRPGALATRFRQAALRRDMELTVVTLEHDGQKCLRVCATMFDVLEMKKKARQYHGVAGLRLTDGKFSAARKARHEKAKTTKPRAAPTLKSWDPAQQVDTTTETYADRFTAMLEDPNVEKDVTLSPGYDRDAILRERLKAFGVAV